MYMCMYMPPTVQIIQILKTLWGAGGLLCECIRLALALHAPSKCSKPLQATVIPDNPDPQDTVGGIYMHICMHMYMHIYMHIYMHMYMHIYMYIYMHIYMHTCMHIYKRIYMHIYMRIYMHIYMHMYMRIYM